MYKTSNIPLYHFRMSDNNYDVAIIGSGILGSAMAHTLARQNRKVVVIERDLSQPNRIVGELLQPGGRIALNNLGMSGFYSL